MSVTPGPKARAVVDPERALGRGPGIEDGVQWPMSSTRGAPARPLNVATTVAPSRPAGSGRISTSAPSSSRNAATQRPTSSTPSGV